MFQGMKSVMAFDPKDTDEQTATKYMDRSEEHTSELQSRFELVCRLLLEKKKPFEPNRRSYGLGTVEPRIERIMRRCYHRCDAVVAHSESMAAVMSERHRRDDVGMWGRGV